MGNMCLSMDMGNGMIMGMDMDTISYTNLNMWGSMGIYGIEYEQVIV